MELTERPKAGRVPPPPVKAAAREIFEVEPVLVRFVAEPALVRLLAEPVFARFVVDPVFVRFVAEPVFVRLVADADMERGRLTEFV